MTPQKSNCKNMGRKLYIIEAAVEYLISIVVSTSFLATLTNHLGFSDSLTGILSSIISLGCFFQLFSIFLSGKRVKTTVIIYSVINQMLFMFLYIIPLLELNGTTKTIIFIATIFTAYLVYNLVHPLKINWLMSQINDKQRGVFTAHKECISLITGMIFSFTMGALTDEFIEIGKIKIAFLITAVVIFVLMGIHTASMALSKEIIVNSREKQSLRNSFMYILQNKKILSVTMVYILYNIANFSTTPFLATYQLNELGFNLKLITGLGIFSSVTRLIVSAFWGKYADKKSFALMMEKCIAILVMAFIFLVFTTEKNGIIFMSFYYLFHGIAMGGINSALMNMIFDYAAPEHRSLSLAVSQAFSGIIGFVTTLAASPLVTLIQSRDQIFGITIYAQQLLAVFSVLILSCGLLYIRKVLIKVK